MIDQRKRPRAIDEPVFELKPRRLLQSLYDRIVSKRFVQDQRPLLFNVERATMMRFQFLRVIAKIVPRQEHEQNQIGIESSTPCA